MADERAPPPYASRRQLVAVGRTRAEILVAAFELGSGGEVLCQLADEGDLRRGGVYLLPPGATEAHAPRFDELFRQVLARAADARSGRTLAKLVERARRWARATRPRPTPAVLSRLGPLGKAARALDRDGPPPGQLAGDALVLALALVFASEEERYPRPRYRGCDVAVERILEIVRDARPDGRPS